MRTFWASSARRWAAALLCVVTVGGGGLLSVKAQTGATSGKSQATGSKPDMGLLTLPEEKPIRGMTQPSLSPDGKTLCFTYQGDLWTVPVAGGIASRLTEHEALDTFGRWSPDGKWIAFTSLRTGSADIFLIPSAGGTPRQVTYHSAPDWVNDWSPDGTKLLFYSQRDTRSFAMYSFDLKTRAVKQLTNDEQPLRFGNWSPDGKSIAYSRAGQPWWRPWYKGSVAANVIVADLTTGKAHPVLKSNGQQFWPLFSADGRSLFITMIYGDSNTPNLWRVPLNGGAPKAVTRYTRDAVRFASIAHNGSLLAYIWDGDLYTIAPEGSNAKKINILVRADEKTNNIERQTFTQGTTDTQVADEQELSPDGKTLALVIHGNIWLLPTTGGDAKRLMDSTSKDDDITWSPDGSKLVFVSDRGNLPNLYTIDIKTKAIVKLTDDADNKNNPTWSPDGKTISYAKAGSKPGLYVVPSTGGVSQRIAEGNGSEGVGSYAWSPDGRWLAFSRSDRYGTFDIWVVPAIGGTAVNVTRYPGFNLSPRWSKDGKQLLFLSSRGQGLYSIPLETPEDLPTSEDGKPLAGGDRSKDVKINFEEIEDRAHTLIPMGGIQEFVPMPDGQRIFFRAFNNFYIASIAGGPSQLVASTNENSSHFAFTSDSAHLFYLQGNGLPHTLSLTTSPPQVASIPFTVHYNFDRRALYLQAFNEFYRRFGTAFYDGSMHGVNWKALRDRYEPLLQAVGTSFEFSDLLSEMVGEVNSSHSEIRPAPYKVTPEVTATLGLFYDNDYPGPGLKVVSVLSKSPADRAASHIRPGEYVLSVDGTDVSLNEDYYQTLQDKANKTVELLVNSKPRKEGARTVKLRALSSAEWANLEYEAQVRHNREMVDKFSGDRLAYLHIKGMDTASLERFRRELYSVAVEKEGLILDIRGNGGGNTHDPILQMLSRPIYGYNQPRDGLRMTQPDRAWNKPVVLLIDQNSYSDAEIFPVGFRALKIGKIVGTPTPGYVIGTQDIKLIDGTFARLPRTGWYTADGTNLENLGVAPDILVENTPDDLTAHRDRQLETAVKTLLNQLPTSVPSSLSSVDNLTTVLSSANANPNGGSSEVHPSAPKKP